MDSRLVEESTTPLCQTLTLTRTKVLNAFNLRLLSQLHSLLSIHDSRRLVLRGAGRAFCAGGDVVHLSKHLSDCEAFFRETYSACYRLDARKGWSVAFMKGVTMGGGAGLSYACKARVALPSTIWAFPETSLGSVPDAGANYVLTRLSSGAVGRYLALTGERLNGVDCFYLGIATHYLPDDKLEPALEAEISTCEDPIVALDQACIVPDRSLCKVLRDQAEIENAFGQAASVEEILVRLRANKSPWADRTMVALGFMCPLSLKVEFRALEIAVGLDYGQCLDLEYDMVVQMTIIRSANYREGVQHRLVRKEKSRPQWVPSTLSEVDPAEIQACLENPTGPKLRTHAIQN